MIAQSLTRDERVAFEESGHAAYCLLALGRDVASVRIDEHVDPVDGPVGGIMVPAGPIARTDAAHEAAIRRDPATAAKFVPLCLAGPAAVARRLGRRDVIYSAGDWHDAETICRIVAGDGWALAFFGAWETARTFFDEPTHWSATRALAYRLLLTPDRPVDGAEATRILRADFSPTPHSGSAA